MGLPLETAEEETQPKRRGETKRFMYGRRRVKLGREARRRDRRRAMNRMSRRWSLGALGLVPIAFGCSSTPSSGSGKDSGADDASVGSGDAGGSGKVDAAVEAGPPGCVVVTGTGANQRCVFTPSDGGCSEAAGMFSACPTANLFGCCTYDPSDAGGMCPDVPGDGGPTAVCYYGDSGTVQQAGANCSTAAYLGSPCSWEKALR
jgi:hypothetical protein